MIKFLSKKQSILLKILLNNQIFHKNLIQFYNNVRLFFLKFIDNIKPSIMTVNQILDVKGNEVHSILSTITVYEALRIMGERNIGAVLVIEDNILKGILSERDYARKIVLKNKTSRETFVHEIMDTDIISVKPDDDINYCMDLITNKRVRHLPVVSETKVIGIVSIGDVVKSIIELQKNTIHHLDSYIHGTKAE